MNTRLGRVEVYAIVGFLGLAVFALGFTAEVTKVKEISRDSYGTCFYPRNPASPIAYVAALLMFIAVIIVSFATTCGCFRYSSTGDNIGAYVAGIIFFVWSWMAAIVGMKLLLSGALINQKHANTSSKCYTVIFAVFAKGGIWGLASCIFGLLSYGFVSKITQNSSVEPGITLGTPSYKQ